MHGPIPSSSYHALLHVQVGDGTRWLAGAGDFSDVQVVSLDDGNDDTPLSMSICSVQRGYNIWLTQYAERPDPSDKVNFYLTELGRVVEICTHDCCR